MKRSTPFPLCAEGTLHRAKPCFIFHAPQGALHLLIPSRPQSFHTPQVYITREAHFTDPSGIYFIVFFQLKKQLICRQDKWAVSLAPQVGLEPTTTRLTAECSAIELLRNIEIRQRPTLPGRVQPSTIGVQSLNFCVRYGNRCDPLAITTGNCELFLMVLLCLLFRFRLSLASLDLFMHPDNCTRMILKDLDLLLVLIFPVSYFFTSASLLSYLCFRLPYSTEDLR